MEYRKDSPLEPFRPIAGDIRPVIQQWSPYLEKWVTMSVATPEDLYRLLAEFQIRSDDEEPAPSTS